MSNLKTYDFHPRFALTAVKTCDFASEETLCFQANITLDGKKVGSVSNDGHGGCDSFSFVDKAARALFDEEAAKLPEETDWNGEPRKRDAEDFVQWLLAEADMKKHAKKYITFLSEGDTEPGGFGYLKVGRKKAPASDAGAIAYLEENRPGVTLVVA
jgi:hypothetical protein